MYFSAGLRSRGNTATLLAVALEENVEFYW